MNMITRFFENFRPDKELPQLHFVSPAILRANGISLVITDLDHTLTALESSVIPSGNIDWLARVKAEGLDFQVVTSHCWRPYLDEITRQIGQKPMQIDNFLSPGADLIERVLEKYHCLPRQAAVINDLRIFLHAAKKMGCMTLKVAPFHHAEPLGLASLGLATLRLIDDRIIFPFLKRRPRPPD